MEKKNNTIQHKYHIFLKNNNNNKQPRKEKKELYEKQIPKTKNYIHS